MISMWSPCPYPMPGGGRAQRHRPAGPPRRALHSNRAAGTAAFCHSSPAHRRSGLPPPAPPLNAAFLRGGAPVCAGRPRSTPRAPPVWPRARAWRASPRSAAGSGHRERPCLRPAGECISPTRRVLGQGVSRSHPYPGTATARRPRRAEGSAGGSHLPASHSPLIRPSGSSRNRAPHAPGAVDPPVTGDPMSCPLAGARPAPRRVPSRARPAPRPALLSPCPARPHTPACLPCALWCALQGVCPPVLLHGV